MIVCACGCGEEFEPRRRWQKFKNADHKKYFWRHGDQLGRAIAGLEFATRALLTASREIAALRKSKREGNDPEKRIETAGLKTGAGASTTGAPAPTALRVESGGKNPNRRA